jgi:NADPH:quinone reductase-like Zn-dependent oxidoreductase
MLRLAESGQLRPPVSLILPLSRIVEAQQAFLSKAHVGKVVLLPQEA